MLWLLVGVSFAGQGKKQQGKVQPFMSGWGLSAHSIIIPLEYPQSFPEIKSGNTPDFSQVGQDIGVGIKGTLFANRKYRASINPYYHHGFNDSNYQALGINLEVDQIAFRDRNIWAYYGLGGGSSNLRFAVDDNNSLSATQIYAKGQVGAMYFDRTKAYEFSVYAKFGTTGRETITRAGETFENNNFLEGNDQLKGSLYYPTIGIQGTIYRGDFRKAMKNPKPKKGKKGNKKKGNR